jgi:hypothetical protein
VSVVVHPSVQGRPGNGAPAAEVADVPEKHEFFVATPRPSGLNTAGWPAATEMA